MHRRFNLLVGLAVLGVLGMLSVLGFLIVQSEASSLNAGDLTQGGIKTETFNPIVDTGHTTGPGAGKVTGYTVTSTPTTALALATYTLEFQVPHDLANGVDQIIVTWVDDFADGGFPSDIAESAVSIRAVGTGVGCGGAGTEVPTCGVTGADGYEGQAVAPEEITGTTVGIKSFPRPDSEFQTWIKMTTAAATVLRRMLT